MTDEFRISYSGRKLFKTCPKQYEYKYVLKHPARPDPRHTMFGSIIGKVFEWFYEHRLWQRIDPIQECVNLIPEAIESVFLSEGYQRGLHPLYEKELHSDLAKYVPLGVGIIKQNRFLTPSSRAEVDLTVLYQKSDRDIPIRLVGRADFVHGEDSGDVYILDGKASKHREKYVDTDQLIWYAASYYLKYHVAPKRLGFVFWSFPSDPVLWIAYDSDSMRSILDDTLSIAIKVRSNQFNPVTSGECHRCIYKCEDGIQYLAKKRKESGGRLTESIFDLESI